MNYCEDCIWFALEPYKKRSGACLNYDERGMYIGTSMAMKACPGFKQKPRVGLPAQERTD